MGDVVSTAKAMAEALRRRLSGKSVDERAEAAKEGAEEASKALPSALMPRQAIERKRKQLEEIDAQTRDE